MSDLWRRELRVFCHRKSEEATVGPYTLPAAEDAMAISFRVSHVSRSAVSLQLPGRTGALSLQGQGVEAFGACGAAVLPAEQHALVQAASR